MVDTTAELAADVETEVAETETTDATEVAETEVAEKAVEENEDVNKTAEGSASDEAEASRVESEADDEGAV